MARIDILDNIRRIDLVLSETGSQNWNPIMNDNSFKIQKGSKNVVEFKIRDSDRRPINVQGKIIECNINYPDGKSFLFSKKLAVVDPSKGLMSMTLLPWELMTWPLGPLSFNVTIKDIDGVRMLYVGEIDSPNGWIEVQDGPYMGPIPSFEPKTFIHMTNNSPISYQCFSDVMPGSNRAFNESGLMSFVFVMNNYSGSIKIWGSLEPSVPQSTDDVWFLISDEFSYNGQSGTILENVISKVEWVIIEFIPVIPLGETWETFDLKSLIEKIQYRNN